MTDSTGDNRDIQLPGYTLVERIGAGGYGEVWLAHAPGGLTKAVKFIFGYHNEKRAASELHSLEKIKEVRHPFLLSLERIEVIEGRLVIITELADGSLKDCFDAHAKNDLPGIPRKELLGYLRDTADALDYLSDKHSLQHLDVKPENLLLLAGHVKVADFGLVKEIQETQASLVGGMTPLYSAPEVFQGRPTSFSDQYSLAVLYQEMLTGTLPFNGTTSAELTLQHMHDEPDLTSLPLADRYVIARALSKNPEQRYPSCREFFQALSKANTEGDDFKSNWGQTSKVDYTAVKRSAVAKSQPRPGTMTQVFEDDLKSDSVEVSESMLIDIPMVSEGEVPSLPALDLRPGDSQPAPTLVIGIGGTAGNVLGQFRKQLSRRFGETSEMPAVQLLLLDTDKKALLETTHGKGASSLNAEETLAMQLRRPQEYRDHAKRLLGWLSRRWLYNIPKSLRTEGLRPLGRLAFADHARRTLQRIRLAVSQAREESSIAESSQQSGLSFDSSAVRVYVVASISGGTGSGMSIDVGYAVKSLLEKLGIENATTTGIFMHSTGRDSRYCDLAKVNAFSWLKEYNHFARPEGCYPGDEASGLPAMPSGTPAFDNTYLVHLGDGLTTDQLKHQSSNVAQYLYLDTLTPANKFFEASRSALAQNISGFPALRTFGFHEESGITQQALDIVEQQLCQQVVFGWSGDAEIESPQLNPNTQSDAQSDAEKDTASLSDTSHIVNGAPQAVSQLQLNLEGISANARGILEGRFGTSPETLLSKLIADHHQDQSDVTLSDAIKVVDTLFAPAPGSEGGPGEYVSGQRLETIVSPLGMKLTGDLQRWLLQRLDDQQERLAGTQQAAEWFVMHLERVEADSHRLGQAIARKLVEMTRHAAAIASDPSKANATDSTESAMELVIKYFRLRVDLCSLQATALLTRMLQSELKNVREATVEFGRHLRHLADSLANDAQAEGTARQDHSVPEDPIIQRLLASLSRLSSKVDLELQDQFINQQGGLFQTIMGNRKVMGELLESLRAIAKQQVALAARELSLSCDQTLDEAELVEFADQANSTLMGLGGVASQLVVLPQNGEREQQLATVHDALGNSTSLLSPFEGNMTVCCEAGQIPLARVAVNLIECRRDYAEFADRVHTRNDISWAPLVDIKPPAPSAVSEFATQVL